jgi:hypothetical protein
MASSQEQVIVSLKAGECDLRVEFIEKEHILRLRAHPPKYKGCHIDKNSMVSVLTAAFLKNDSPKLEGNYSARFIGRLIDYPWLSQSLATAAYRDQGWDSKKGKPIAMDINKYVSPCGEIYPCDMPALRSWRPAIAMRKNFVYSFQVLIKYHRRRESAYENDQVIGLCIGGFCCGNGMGELFKTTRSGKRGCQESNGCRFRSRCG